MDKAKVIELLNNAGADATGVSVEAPSWRESGRGMVVATLVGAGAITSSVTVQGSHDGANWVTIGAALALSGAGADSKAQAVDSPWPFLRAVAASGTGARTKLVVTLAQ